MSAPAPIRPATSAVTRSNFGFCPDGREVACIRTSAEVSTLELWSFAPRGTRPHALRARRFGQLPGKVRASGPELIHQNAVVDPGARLLPLGDGRVLVLTDRGGLAELELIDPSAPRGHLVGQVRAADGYLLPSPSVAQLGFLVAREDQERTAVWRLTDGPPGVEPLVRLPGAATGGVWLDTDADLLALNLSRPGHAVEGVLADLRRGSWQPLFSMSPASDDRILLHHQRSKLLLVRSTSPGADRVGWVLLDGAGSVRFPERLCSTHVPLTVDESGQRVLLRRESGALSALDLYSPREDRLAALTLPPGRIGDRAHLHGRTARVPFSSPARPSTLVTVAPNGSCSPLPEDTRPELPPWASADLLRLGGGVEAIVYGGAQWRSCEHVVLALHHVAGELWRWEFHPLFQDLAAVGVAVIAPNRRGEDGRWGGPDLAGVISLGHHLRSQRPSLPGPVLLGGGHGGLLGLQAAGSTPGLWSGCAALAPLLGDADELGLTAPANTAPVLLAHGTRDEVVPVERARALRRALDGPEAANPWLHYVEFDAEHEPVASVGRRALREKVVAFCLGRLAPSPGVR
ncbi:S9 family peptidase [Saccharopolyspora sp. MS10]|uniref:alpha/beta hydrolase family protein n=1 Tax=Saccharopolyspora sp. MS10 TaxID=3385973 RepID=UPI0039A2B95E